MNDIDPALLARYDGLRVPRYTSYPTAPHFAVDFGEEAYAAELSSVSDDAAASLYLHIPFCRRMCWFCGCHTKIVARHDPVQAYVATLRREIALVAGRSPRRLRVRHIHFGGGSPTILAPAEFEAIVGDLRSLFDVAPDAEVAVEVDPRGLTPELAAAMARAGVNRASLGVQDFDPKVQEAVNRVQPLEVTRRAIDDLRAVGIVRLNLDLMYGLPGQGVDTAERAARIAVDLAPDRFSVFGYAHVPWMKVHQKKIDETTLADSFGRWLRFQAMARVLVEAGYRPIGIDHFARPDDELTRRQAEGRLARNFQGYTDDDATVLLGFGASAIGAFPGAYVQNLTPIEQYEAAVEAGRLPIARGLRLSNEDRLRRAVIERLMCDLSVDTGAVAALNGAPVDRFGTELAGMADLVADGVVVVEGNRVTVPEIARPLVRVVAARFDTYLGAGAGRHSRAV